MSSVSIPVPAIRFTLTQTRLTGNTSRRFFTLSSSTCSCLTNSFATAFLFIVLPPPPPSSSTSVRKLKELIHRQTSLDPQYQELFFENLPYQPSELVTTSKLPDTTVSCVITKKPPVMCTLINYCC